MLIPLKAGLALLGTPTLALAIKRIPELGEAITGSLLTARPANTILNIEVEIVGTVLLCRGRTVARTALPVNFLVVHASGSLHALAGATLSVPVLGGEIAGPRPAGLAVAGSEVPLVADGALLLARALALAVLGIPLLRIYAARLIYTPAAASVSIPLLQARTIPLDTGRALA